MTQQKCNKLVTAIMKLPYAQQFEIIKKLSDGGKVEAEMLGSKITKLTIDGVKFI